jgi:RNA polymerase sigma-70 factor (ECF subfamily)
VDCARRDAIVAAATAGDPAAFGLLWQELSPRVAAYLRSHGVADSEDLTSEVFLAVFRQVDRISGGGAGFEALVFTVAHRRQVDWHRQRVRRGSWVPWEEVGPGPVGPSAETVALVSLEEQGVVEVLGRLTPDQRAVLTLRVVADLSLEATAAVLGKDVGSVKSLQHRALARLRREVSAEPYPREVLTRLNPRHA